MASNDDELVAEVRALTNFQDDVISDSDMRTLVTIAKREIRTLSGLPSPDWYEENDAEQALFWLTALFTKVHTGHIGGVSYSVGELEQAPLRETNQFWLNRFQQHLSNLSAGTLYGHTSVSRPDRTYGYE